MKLLMSILLSFTSFAQAADKPITHTIDDKNIQWTDCPELFPKGCKISVLQGSPEKENTDIFFKVPGNYKIPAHTHTSAEHMTLVSGRLEVKYKGEDKVNMKPGTYAYGPAEHPHEAKCMSKEPCVLFISFDQPVDSKPYKEKI